jgi:nitronate monooxygenase
LPAAVNCSTRWLAVLGYFDAGALIRLQSSRLPVSTPLVPLDGMPDSTVDTGALYAGDTALRISEVVSAQQAVNDLAP